MPSLTHSRAVLLAVASALALAPHAIAANVGDVPVSAQVAIYRHVLDAHKGPTGYPEPVFLATGKGRARLDPPLPVLRALAGTGVDVRPFRQKSAFEHEWLENHPEPAGDSEARNTATLISIESLAFPSTTDATARVRINWYAVGRGDYGASELHKIELRRTGGSWTVTTDDVIDAAG